MHHLADIAAAMDARLVGNPEIVVLRPCAPSDAGPDDLALAMDPKFEEAIKASGARAAVLSEASDWQALGLEAAIIVARPRYAMAHITRHFAKPDAQAFVHKTALIDATTSIGADPSIGAYSIVGAQSVIGDAVHIAPQVYIGSNVRIGDHARIGPGVRILDDVVIGHNAIVHANAVIGSDGFSFVTPKPGSIDQYKSSGAVADQRDEQEYVRIYSLGAVVIGDDVEIGAGTTIDRGTVEPTVIGNGTKLDNLVQIGHNVKIGDTCLICGQVGIAGSSRIGNQVVLAGQVGVADHVTVGDNVIAAGKSGISSNVPPNRVIMGDPAVRMENNIESYKAIRRLPRFLSRLVDLEKQVSKLTSTK